MATQKRPLSPHLQVYRLPILAVMSIVHRGTGVVNAFGALIFALWIAGIAAGPEQFAAYSQLFNGTLAKLLLLAFCFSLSYHFFNGVRHLLWDIGWGYELPKAYASGYAVLALASLVSAWLATVLFTGGLS